MEYKDYKNRELNIRVSESQRILKKYPHMIPIILEKYNNQSPDLKYYKYFVFLRLDKIWNKRSGLGF